MSELRYAAYVIKRKILRLIPTNDQCSHEFSYFKNMLLGMGCSKTRDAAALQLPKDDPVGDTASLKQADHREYLGSALRTTLLQA